MPDSSIADNKAFVNAKWEDRELLAMRSIIKHATTEVAEEGKEYETLMRFLTGIEAEIKRVEAQELKVKEIDNLLKNVKGNDQEIGGRLQTYVTEKQRLVTELEAEDLAILTQIKQARRFLNKIRSTHAFGKSQIRSIEGLLKKAELSSTSAAKINKSVLNMKNRTYQIIPK
jgi:hypothetical protein